MVKKSQIYEFIDIFNCLYVDLCSFRYFQHKATFKKRNTLASMGYNVLFIAFIFIIYEHFCFHKFNIDPFDIY